MDFRSSILAADLGLHGSGASLAEALRLARDGTEREPMLAATGWSFLALGAA